MSGEANKTARPHQLSPSAWNRYETCPRMYWLSRQGLPRKAGMAASIGTAVHASLEDLLNMDLSAKKDTDAGWLKEEGEILLRARWEEEKILFFATPRHPQWKEDKWSEAIRQQKGGVILLLDHIGIRGLPHEKVTAALWRKIQSLVIAVEGELKTSDGRLMGRLDLLIADVDDEGKLSGWVVADFKTGRAPEGTLKSEVNRQLLMYRDILLANNPNAPPVVAEGWYTKTSAKWEAKGDNVLEQAFDAWQKTQPTPLPMAPQIGDESCGGFCDWKAWCPHWWKWRSDNGTLHKADFADAVILLHDIDLESGAAAIELCEPLDDSGRVLPSGIRTSAKFDGRGLEALKELLETGHQGPIFVGSVMTQGRAWRIGHWCDVLPWNPIPDDIEYHREY